MYQTRTPPQAAGNETARYLHRLRFNGAVIALLLALTFLLFVLSLSVGAARISIEDTVRVLLNPFFPVNVQETSMQVILSIRLPRSLAALFAGMALSTAGLLMQGVFQNPLVSPYTLGVSSGAAFGASLAMIFRGKFLSTLPFLRVYLLPVSAFVFSLLTMLLVYGIAKLKAGSGRILLLAGVAIGYLFSAMVASIRYFSDIRDLPELVFWTMGGLNDVPKSGVLIIALADIAAISFMMVKAWDINALALGEEQALSLGVSYKRIRIIAFIVSTLMTSAAVSFTGVIGFIGLMAPHIIRIIIGSDYRWTIPASALTGALILLASDTIARTIIAPAELPVGIITSFIGVPFFLYLIIRSR